MKYAIDSYIKAKAKWGRINEMQNELDKTMRERANIEQGMNKLFSEMMNGLSGKKTEIKGVALKDGTDESKLYMTPKGFGYIPSWRRNVYVCDSDKKLYETIARNRDKILESIPKNKQDKKEIISIFIRVWEKHNYNFEPIRIIHRINKTIEWIEHGYSNRDETRKAKAESCFIELKGNDSRIGFVFRGEGDLRDFELEERNYKENMIKEQLYLPLWKLLVKAKRRADKELRRIRTINNELRGELTPFIVAKEI
jgi:hypothetical protein